MSLRRKLSHSLRALTNREAADRDVADEVQDYLEQATAALEESGLSRDDARSCARVEFGNPTLIREQVRSYGWENLFGTLTADLHYAARQLLCNPGFALVSILTLALGIGASTAIFSAVNPILFQPLPYPHADRLTLIQETRNNGSPATPHLWYIPRVGGGEPRLRGDGSDEAMAAHNGWRRRAGAIRGSTRERRLLPCARGIAIAGTRLSGA